MEYKLGSVSMIEDGEHDGVIVSTKEYNNPSGSNKLIVEISLEDGILFSYFFSPGFPVFEELIKLTGETPKPVGAFDEQALVDIPVRFTTKITEAKNGSEYCNVVSIQKLVDKKKDSTI